MIRTPQWIGALLLAFFCVGCTTSDITNITPSRLQRNTTGLYKVEMIWESNAEALMPETIVGEVQVQGHNATYPMKTHRAFEKPLGKACWSFGCRRKYSSLPHQGELEI